MPSNSATTVTLRPPAATTAEYPIGGRVSMARWTRNADGAIVPIGNSLRDPESIPGSFAMAPAVKLDFEMKNRLDRLARDWLNTWGAEDETRVPDYRE